MGRYAEKTKVEIDKSQANILALVKKHGAEDYISGTRGGVAFVAFAFHGYPVCIKAPPLPEDYKDEAQERRRHWRLIEFWVKAQLEALREGLLDPAEAFMPYLQLNDGRTVGQAVRENGIKALGHTLALPGPEPKERR